MLGNSITDRKYLSIRNGRVVYKNGDNEELYTFVEGYLNGIAKRERTFNGETVPVWYLNLRNEDGGEYCIAFPYNAGSFKSIVLCLASLEHLSTSTVVRIDAYEKDGFTKVVTRANGEKLNWVTSELPPTREVVVSGQIVKDSTERMRYIEGLVEGISKKLENGELGELGDLIDKMVI